MIAVCSSRPTRPAITQPRRNHVRGSGSVVMPGLSVEVPLSLIDHRLRVVPAEPGQQKQVSHEIDDVRLGHITLTEPPRVSRRPFCLAQAARVCTLAWA